MSAISKMYEYAETSKPTVEQKLNIMKKEFHYQKS